MMIRTLQQLNNLANRHSAALLLAGLAGVAWHNWRLWQQDKARLARKDAPAPLPPLEMWPERPLVSVLVAAWNEAEHIDRHIESVLSLRYPNKELVLCAGGSDGTYERAKQYAGSQVKVVEQPPGEGKQRALYRCLPHSSGAIIFLTDADCILDSESFERLIYPLILASETVSTGISRPLSSQMEQTFVHHQWTLQRYGQILNTANYVAGLLGRNCALTRPVLEEAWKEEHDVPTGTDYYLALRVREAGCRILQVSESSVETAFPESLSQYIGQQTRWVRNLLVLGVRFGDKYHVRHALLTSLIGAFLLAMPIMPLFLGQLGLVGWLITWSAVGTARLRYASLLNRLEEQPTRLLSVDLLKVMWGDFIAWSRVLVDVWNPEWKKRW